MIIAYRGFFRTLLLIISFLSVNTISAYAQVPKPDNSWDLDNEDFDEHADAAFEDGINNKLYQIAREKGYTYFGPHTAFKLKIRHQGKYAFMNMDGSIAGTFYDFVVDFKNGYAGVSRNKKWGIIDMNGNEIVQPRYDMADDFYDGLARVVLNGKFGYIDTKGNEITPIAYDYAGNFSDGFAWVKKNDEWVIMDKKGKEIKSLKIDGVQAFSNGVAVVSKSYNEGLIDATGNSLTRIKYAKVYKFRENKLALVKTERRQYGFINRNGEEVIKPVYEDAFAFEAGLARVKQNGKWGYIDSTGKLLIPLQFDFAFDFDKKSGVAIAARNMEYFFIDRSGKPVSNFRWIVKKNVLDEPDYKVPVFWKGLAIVSNGASLYRIQSNGLGPKPLPYSVAGNFNSGRAMVGNGKKYGFIDANGDLVIPLKYDEVSSFENYTALVREGNSWKIIDQSGEVLGVMPSTIEKSSLVIKYDRVAVKSGGKWGYMDTSGELIIPCQFEEAYNFSEELAVVKKDGKYGYINNIGKMVTPFAFSGANSFYNGFAAVKLQGGWGMIDKTGRLRIPARFKAAGKFYDDEIEMEVASDENSLFPVKAKLNTRSIPVLED